MSILGIPKKSIMFDETLVRLNTENLKKKNETI